MNDEKPLKPCSS